MLFLISMAAVAARARGGSLYISEHMPKKCPGSLKMKGEYAAVNFHH